MDLACIECGQTITITEGIPVNLRCSKCGNIRMSINVDSMITCIFCGTERRTFKDKLFYTRCPCSFDRRTGNSAIWTVKERKRNQWSL